MHTVARVFNSCFSLLLGWCSRNWRDINRKKHDTVRINKFIVYQPWNMSISSGMLNIMPPLTRYSKYESTPPPIPKSTAVHFPVFTSTWFPTYTIIRNTTVNRFLLSTDNIYNSNLTINNILRTCLQRQTEVLWRSVLISNHHTNTTFYSLGLICIKVWYLKERPIFEKIPWAIKLTNAISKKVQKI